MNNYFWTDKNTSYWLALAVSLLPLLSLIMGVATLGGQDTEAAVDANPQTASGFGLLGSVFLIVGGGFVLAKIMAIVGNFRRWYYGWVFHAAEIVLVLFVLGILAIVSTFSQSFDLLGLVKLGLIFIALAMNLYLRSLWGERSNKDLYRVSFYTHS